MKEMKAGFWMLCACPSTMKFYNINIFLYIV